ncbi:MAG TPA: hypothetical protein DDZ51_19675 [Planctomycetaceae bacterium]|nr:hypothetical protein [Planctomycetaceae bacterium]
MNPKLRALIVVAVVAASVGNAPIAEAKKIRSTAERRQHPERGFWENDHKQKDNHVRHHQPMIMNHWKSVWSEPKTYKPKTHTPAKKSWGWQRSSRAALHHPGTRRTR